MAFSPRPRDLTIRRTADVTARKISSLISSGTTVPVAGTKNPTILPRRVTRTTSRGTSSSRDAPRVKSRYNRRMAAAIVVTESVRVPEHALQVRAARASGPGGQNVNKVATKIELRVDLGAIEGLSDAARARLGTLSRGRLDADGRLMVTSQATRTQARNLEDAREKVRTLIAAALREPRRRRKSRPPAGATERRLEVKKHRGALKRGRARLEE